MNLLNRLIWFIKNMAIVLLAFSLTRLLFFIVNFQVFTPINGNQVFRSFFLGLQFDYSSIFYMNLVLILLLLLPKIIWENKIYFIIYKSLFIFINSILLILNLMDVEYFKIIKSRSSFDVIALMFESNDILMNVPSFIASYWYLLMFALIGGWAFYKMFTYKSLHKLNFKLPFIFTALIYISFILVSFGLARGLQLKSLRIVNALQYVEPTYAQLVLNTPFNIVNTVNETSVKEVQYLSKKQLDATMQYRYNFETNKEFRPKNIVLIIFEGINASYMGIGKNSTSIMPFMDIIIQNGLSCENNFANGKRSAEALPALFSSLPVFTNKTHVTSKYAVNKINSLPSFLQNKGYSTSFFHGGKNGTMSFDIYCESAGIQDYFGLDEYPDETKYDGHWGIPDKDYMDFFADKLMQKEEPFFSSIFLLTSHHPYQLPSSEDSVFYADSLTDHQKTIVYVDKAIQHFFRKISSASWFDNTLFVFTSDHTSQAAGSSSIDPAKFQVPMIFYCPSDTSLRGEYSSISQHIDFFPTILDYLHYDTTAFVFGNSIFSQKNRFNVNKVGALYHYQDDTAKLIFDGDKVNQAYSMQNNTLQKRDFNPLSADTIMLNRTKGLIQDYFQRLMSNEFTRLPQ